MSSKPSKGRLAPSFVARRLAFVTGLSACALAASCHGPNDRAPELAATSVARASKPAVSVLASFDFPRNARTKELSGIAWDESAGVLYAVQDEAPLIVPLTPGAGFRTWSAGEPIVVKIDTPWDGEGIALTSSSFIIANEAGPRVLELDRAGAIRGELTIPSHYATSLPNLALESLSLTPDARFLFTTNESALSGDAPKPSEREGTTLRILRIDRETNARVEFAYRSDPIFSAGDKGMIGVADLAAISEDDLLVLERAYVPSVGNQLRVYRAALRGAEDVIGVAALTAATPVVQKTLLFDLASFPEQDIRAQTGVWSPHSRCPNFEGLAFGPKLPDGRRVLFLVSDDNGMPQQVSRLLTLAVSGLF